MPLVVTIKGGGTKNPVDTKRNCITFCIINKCCTLKATKLLITLD